MPQIANSTYQISPPPNLFYDLYKFKDYAIWFGIIEPIKNQLATIEVLREKGIPLVLVGRYRDQNYYEACVAAGGESTLFISALPVGSEIVRAALKESLFYIEVPFEPPGLSAIEAGLSGCKMVLSDSSWSREIFGSDIEFCNPSDIGSISDAVDRVLESTPSLIGCDRLKKHSSGESIKKIINVLKSVI